MVEKSAVHDTMIDGLLFINKLPFLPPHLHVVMAGAQSDNVVLIPEQSTSQRRKLFFFVLSAGQDERCSGAGALL